MISAESKHSIEVLCPGIDPAVINDFFARMDADYFSTFSTDEIAAHIRMSSALDAHRPAEVRVSERTAGSGEFDVVIVGFDYLSEFSVFCGLLSAFGLNIRSGSIYSFGKEPSKSRRKIVDVFSVDIQAGAVFDEARQREFAEQLQTFARLLAAGSLNEARERLSRILTERIETAQETLTGLLSPIDLEFDNASDPDWTVMHARSQDVFAFLYSISNALAMHSIYIHKVKIESRDDRVMDQFFVADRWGRKIEDAGEQARLRTAVAMLKQFTRFLPEAPDPAKAIRHFDQFLDKASEARFPAHVLSFLARAEGMERLARLLGSSDFLWDDFLGIHFENLLPVLEDLNKNPLQTERLQKARLRQELRDKLGHGSSFEDKRAALNQFRDARLFLIDAAHVLNPADSLTAFSQALTDLAEVVLDGAARICDEHLGQAHGAYTIFALGKFGGKEMGYASDLELMFVHETAEDTSFFERLARCIIEVIETRKNAIFHVDLRLRPYGDAGSWSIPFDEFARYYSVNGQAAPFERQALIRLRWVGGDEALGRRVEAHRDRYTYSGEPWNAEDALHLRRRQMRELAKPGAVNVKYSAGGIVDVEYAVQYLQLVHGAARPELRLTNTLEALEQLHGSGIIERDRFEILRGGYLFLRKLIDALRIVRGDASDLVLPEEDSDEFKTLARRLGYRERDWKKGAALLAVDIREWMGKVHQQFPLG